MAHIQPFTISGYEFRHVEVSDPQTGEVGLLWHELKSGATRNWRGGDEYIRCGVGEPFELFGIYDSLGSIWGIWSLYRIREVGTDSISAICSPTFPEVKTLPPQTLLDPAGSGEVIDTEHIDHALESRERFWRQTFACIEAMLTTPMEMLDGSTRRVDHFRFPSVADGDPAQHEWSGVEDHFDRYCKIGVEFDQGTAVKTLPTWKTTDPDPERTRGEFDAS